MPRMATKAGSYGEASIKVLKGLEPVKQRPGMYTRTENPLHTIQEVIDNASDEALGGYGKQIILRHANGYETSYNHQSAFAKGIEPGVHVRQGQTIGFLGQTGLSTGPHLHYELIVNGTKVDPMRVRLPTGRVLSKGELEAFERERKRIDDLLKQDAKDGLKVAAAAGLPE